MMVIHFNLINSYYSLNNINPYYSLNKKNQIHSPKILNYQVEEDQIIQDLIKYWNFLIEIQDSKLLLFNPISLLDYQIDHQFIHWK